MANRDPENPPNLDEPHLRLQWLRVRAGFSDATAAARRHHWNINTYRSHENGIRAISRKAAATYAKAFKVTAGWILYGEGAMTSPIDPELVTIWETLTEPQRRQAKRLLRALKVDDAA